MPDWDRELAKIDKQLESISDDQLITPPAGATPAQQQVVVVEREKTSTFGALARLFLAVLVGVAILFWPYSARCGAGLAAYLGAVGVVVLAGVWSAVWTWRHRTAKAHLLSLLVVLWGLVLGGLEILPRTGYAIPTAAHPAAWSCQ
ncbi:MAG TPA: hypothetical protein VFZ11_00965 [Gemmatimonadaceae bacterium]